MKSLRVLFLTTEMAPLTADSPRARGVQFQSRAMAELGVEVTVAVPGHLVPDDSRLGLARRLSPVLVPSDSTHAPASYQVNLHEGFSASGRVSLVVIDISGADEAAGPVHDIATFGHTALCLAKEQDTWPDVLIAGPGTEAALALAKARGDAESPAPVAIYEMQSLDDSPEVGEALAQADRIVVPSKSWELALRKHIADPRQKRSRPSKLLGAVGDSLCGIPVGIDSTEWNPHQDSSLVKNFMADPGAGKARHKERIQKQLGLRLRPEVALVAVTSPLDPNVLTYGVAIELARANLQLAVLADPEVDAVCLRHLERLANVRKNQIGIFKSADAEARLAFEHQLVAGADFALVPREFSPSPLSELYFMRYGAAPIAPATGNCADVLVEFDGPSATGSGFLFAPAHDLEALMAAVHRAVREFDKKSHRDALRERVMSVDLSWKAPAQRYVNAILDLLRSMQRLAA